MYLLFNINYIDVRIIYVILYLVDFSEVRNSDDWDSNIIEIYGIDMQNPILIKYFIHFWIWSIFSIIEKPGDWIG